MRAVIAAQAAIHVPRAAGGHRGQASGGRLKSPTHAEISEVEP